MELEEYFLPPIMTLPSEIRGTIFSKLQQKQAIRCRQVCRQFRDDIDEWVDLVVDIDENEPHLLQRVVQLRIKEIKVISLVGPPPSGHVGTTILKNPHLLKVIKVPNSKIYQDNLHYLLVDSGTVLEELDLTLTHPISTVSCLASEYKLPNLKLLSLNTTTLPQEPVFGPPSALPANSLPCALLSSSMNRMTTLTISIRCLGFRQVSQLSALVLRLISNQWKTLASLDFDLIQGHGVPSSEERELADSDMEKINVSKLSKAIYLQDVRMVNSTAVGIPLWAQLLSNQKKLAYLETDILPASAALFRQIILNNAETLREIDIGDLTLDTDAETGETTPFDIAVFAECVNLQKLTLDRNSMIRRREGVAEPELINLFNLPKYLEELNINYFYISSYELLILFTNSGEQFHLKSLSLTQCGDIRDFGVDGSCLQTILELPSIQFIEISPLNFCDPLEAQKLNLILQTFGYPQGHSYFQLNRVNAFREQVDMDDFEP